MAYDNTGIEHYTIKDFKFKSGVTKDAQIAYRSFNPQGSKGAILIPTCKCHSGQEDVNRVRRYRTMLITRRPTGFGGRINGTLNFTEGALKDYHVIVVAMLGNGESSSPSNDEDFPDDYSLRYEVGVTHRMPVALLTCGEGLHKLTIHPGHQTSRHQIA